MVQLGNVISANIYRADDAPLYHRGNTALIIINVLALVLFVLTKFYYIIRNKWKAKKWASLTEDVRCLQVLFMVDQYKADRYFRKKWHM